MNERRLEVVVHNRETDLSSYIEAHRIDLENTVCTEFGFLGMLRSMDVLSHEQSAAIESMPGGVYPKVKQLFDFVIGMLEHKVLKFLEALENTHQKLISNYIRSKGKRRREYGDDRPLIMSTELNLIDQNWYELDTRLDIQAGLLNELFSKEVLSHQEKQSIKSTEQLLSITRRKNIADFKKFRRCLTDTKQQHIASLLMPQDTEGPLHFKAGV